MPRSDTHTTLGELKAEVRAFAGERDWLQFHSPKNLSMGIAAEAAELMEHFLWSDAEQSRAACEDENRRAVEDELADVVIYAMQFANVAGIDLSAAIDRKLKANAKKYPVEKARGKALKYDQL